MGRREDLARLSHFTNFIFIGFLMIIQKQVSLLGRIGPWEFSRPTPF
jgi:hypothetical protein